MTARCLSVSFECRQMHKMIWCMQKAKRAVAEEIALVRQRMWEEIQVQNFKIAMHLHDHATSVRCPSNMHCEWCAVILGEQVFVQLCLESSTPEHRCVVLLQGYHRAAGKLQARNTVNITATAVH